MDLQLIIREIVRPWNWGVTHVLSGLCEYKASELSSLTKHMLTHTGARPFACSECDYRAAQKTNITVHMREHSNEKPFACSECDYRTARKADFTDNMRTHSNKNMLSQFSRV